MSYRKILYACGPALLFSAFIAAQVQINPYLAYLTEEPELVLMTDDGQSITYAGDRYGFGVDLLLGARKLVPLAGVLYRLNRYDLVDGSTVSRDRLLVPLGLGYRLRKACTSFNLVPSVAVVPAFRLGDAERGIDWQARIGLTLYLDMITLGANYHNDFFALSLGGRF